MQSQIFSLKSIFLFLLSIVLFMGCTKTEDGAQKADSISYLVNEIGVKLGRGASSAVPTVSGSSPFTFSISNVTSTDDNFLLDPSAITINSTNGGITLEASSDLPVGSYVLDISVSNIGGTSEFTNVFTFIIYDLPSNLVYDPASAQIDVDQNFASEKPSVAGSGTLEYMIANPTEIGDFISINSSTGVINVDGETSLAGSYMVDIEVKNSFGGTTFPDAFQIEITTPLPENLIYDPNTVELLAGADFSSSAPSIDGRLPMQYSIINSNEIGSFVEIDPTTGVIHVILGQSIVGTHTVSVSASNSFGSTSFNEIFTIKITNLIPNVEGKWALTEAILLDEPLTVKNVPVGVNPDTGLPIFSDVTYQVGDDVVAIVGAALAGVACEDPANYGTFFLTLETKDDGTQAVIFTCASETVSSEVGIWEVLKDTEGNYTILSLVVTVDGVPYPIKVEQATFSATNVVGTINGYPTKVDLTKELLDPGNLQTLNASVTLTRLP